MDKSPKSLPPNYLNSNLFLTLVMSDKDSEDFYIFHGHIHIIPKFDYLEEIKDTSKKNKGEKDI